MEGSIISSMEYKRAKDGTAIITKIKAGKISFFNRKRIFDKGDVKAIF
jgi:hypothetical protein